MTPEECTLGVGCDEVGRCYAEAHGRPDQCGRMEISRRDAARVAREREAHAIAAWLRGLASDPHGVAEWLAAPKLIAAADLIVQGAHRYEGYDQ